MTPASDDAEPPETAARRARGIEHEILAEMAEEERDRILELPIAFLEWLWRGDRVRVRAGGSAFDGFVVHVGQDLATLQTGNGQWVEIAIGEVLSVVVTAPGLGPARSLERPDPRRFVARLREFAAGNGPSVVVGAEHGAHELTGRIVRVHADHVAFTADDGSEWALPLGTIAYVRRAVPGLPQPAILR